MNHRQACRENAKNADLVINQMDGVTSSSDAALQFAGQRAQMLATFAVVSAILELADAVRSTRK